MMEQKPIMKYYFVCYQIITESEKKICNTYVKINRSYFTLCEFEIAITKTYLNVKDVVVINYHEVSEEEYRANVEEYSHYLKYGSKGCLKADYILYLIKEHGKLDAVLARKFGKYWGELNAHSDHYNQICQAVGMYAKEYNLSFDETSNFLELISKIGSEYK